MTINRIYDYILFGKAAERTIGDFYFYCHYCPLKMDKVKN